MNSKEEQKYLDRIHALNVSICALQSKIREIRTLIELKKKQSAKRKAEKKRKSILKMAELCIAGKTLKEIGKIFGISAKTVEGRIRMLMSETNNKFFRRSWKSLFDFNSIPHEPNKQTGLGTVTLLRKYPEKFGL